MGAHVLLWQTDIRQDIIKIKGRGNDKQQASGNVQANNSFISLILFRVSNRLIHSVLAKRRWLTRSQHIFVWHWIFERFWVHGVPDVFLALLTRSKISDQLIQPARGILSCTKKYRKNSGQQLLFYHKPAWSLCDQNRSRFDKKYRKTISGTKFTRAREAAWEKITSVDSDVACTHDAFQKQTCMIQLFVFIRKISKLKLLK